MHKAIWLSEYTKHTNPQDAKRNNNESGLLMIETAFLQVAHTLALSTEDKARICKWMNAFRKL